MKYNIAGKIWIINFINEGKTKDHFNSFETNTSEEPLHTINFEVVESIEPLRSLNEIENGLHMYVINNVKYFDIEDDNKKVIIRGEYQGNVSTFYFLKGFEEIEKYEYILSYMRFAEIISKHYFITLHASCVTLGNHAFIITGNRTRKAFTSEWLKKYNSCELISNDKLIVKLENNMLKVYATPWSGEKIVENNQEWILKTILFLEKGIFNRFIELNTEQKIKITATDLGIMTDTLDNNYLFDFCINLVDKVDIYKYKGKIKNVNDIFKKIYFN